MPCRHGSATMAITALRDLSQRLRNDNSSDWLTCLHVNMVICSCLGILSVNRAPTLKADDQIVPEDTIWSSGRFVPRPRLITLASTTARPHDSRRWAASLRGFRGVEAHTNRVYRFGARNRCLRGRIFLQEMSHFFGR